MARGQHLLWWFQNTKDELLNPPCPRYMIQNVSMDTFCIIYRGQGGFKSSSLVFWNHQSKCCPRAIDSWVYTSFIS